MMERIKLRPILSDQHHILYWGKLAGFCSSRPNMPVCFLAGRMDRLTAEEKADIIEYVQAWTGNVRRTNQTKEAWHVIDRRNSTGG